MTTVLFLCTGNTCRSPMAECLFNRLCGQKDLPLRAVSAGVSALAGSPASKGALAAMKARGLSLDSHRAQPLTPALFRDVSLIVAMTPEHAELCHRRFPGLTLPIRSFVPPIPDPYGGSPAVYKETAKALETQVSALFAELSKALA